MYSVDDYHYAREQFDRVLLGAPIGWPKKAATVHGPESSAEPLRQYAAQVSLDATRLL